MQIKPMFPEKMIVGVRGNCDFGSLLPWEEELSVEGKKDFFYSRVYLSGENDII